MLVTVACTRRPGLKISVSVGRFRLCQQCQLDETEMVSVSRSGLPPSVRPHFGGPQVLVGAMRTGSCATAFNLRAHRADIPIVRIPQNTTVMKAHERGATDTDLLARCRDASVTRARVVGFECPFPGNALPVSY